MKQRKVTIVEKLQNEQFPEQHSLNFTRPEYRNLFEYLAKSVETTKGPCLSNWTKFDNT